MFLRVPIKVKRITYIRGWGEERQKEENANQEPKITIARPKLINTPHGRYAGSERAVGQEA